MTSPTTVQPALAIDPSLALPRAEAGIDAEAQAQLARACDLLAQALCTRDAAYANLAENPDDARDANAAVEVARATERTAREVARGNRREAGNLTALLNATSATVGAANSEVRDHDGASGGEAQKRDAHLAEAANDTRRSSSRTASATAYGARSRSAVRSNNNIETDNEPARRRAAAAERQRIDRDDEHYVGERGHRRVRKATSSAGRTATSALGAVIGEANADEIVSTAGTAAESYSSGVAAMASGNSRAAEAAATRAARGWRNVMRDDLGLDNVLGAGASENIAHAGGEVLRAGGRIGSGVSGAVIGGYNYVSETATAGVGYVAGLVGLKSQPARPATPPQPRITLNGIGVGSAAAAARALRQHGVDVDTNDDGRVTVGEVQAAAAQWNRTHPNRSSAVANARNAADTNDDGRLSQAEVNAAIRRAGKTFAQADSDHNGAISNAELANLNAPGGRRPAAPAPRRNP